MLVLHERTKGLQGQLFKIIETNQNVTKPSFPCILGDQTQAGAGGGLSCTWKYLTQPLNGSPVQSSLPIRTSLVMFDGRNMAAKACLSYHTGDTK